MLDRLWSGWRTARFDADTDAGRVPPGDGSVFTRIFAAVAAGDLTDEGAYIVHRGDTVAALLNAYPYGTGHLLVLPYREVATLEACTPAERDELWAVLQDGARAVTEAYRPDGLNLGFNIGQGAGASVPTHLHGHVLPRWSADTNFLTSLAEARVLPEPLSTTWSRVRAAWPTAEPHR